jgi:hypothetical protein
MALECGVRNPPHVIARCAPGIFVAPSGVEAFHFAAGAHIGVGAAERGWSADRIRKQTLQIIVLADCPTDLLHGRWADPPMQGLLKFSR